MTATIHRLPVPKGYSIWGDCNGEGATVWRVDLADSDGVIHSEWSFVDRAEAVKFVAQQQGGAHGTGLPLQSA